MANKNHLAQLGTEISLITQIIIQTMNNRDVTGKIPGCVNRHPTLTLYSLRQFATGIIVNARWNVQVATGGYR